MVIRDGSEDECSTELSEPPRRGQRKQREKTQIPDQKRTATGHKDEVKDARRRLRRAGQVPAVVYGGSSEAQSVQLEQEKTWVASQKEWFYSSIIDLDVDGKVQKVLLRDMQRHP